MLKKLLTAFTCLSLTWCATSTALEITGGKVLAHKEWKSGQVLSSSYQYTPIKLLHQRLTMNQKLLGLPQDTDMVFALTLPPDMVDHTDTELTFQGLGGAIIRNDSSKTQHYTLNSMLCALDVKGGRDCTIQEDQIELAVGGTADSDIALSLVVENKGAMVAGMFISVYRDGAPIYTTGSVAGN